MNGTVDSFSCAVHDVRFDVYLVPQAVLKHIVLRGADLVSRVIK